MTQRQDFRNLTRRDFIRDTAAAATMAGLATSLNVGAAGAGNDAAIRKTRSYNPDMEYRRAGKTNMWVSAVCLGGHWKRVDMVVPGVFGGGGWLSAKLDDEGFRKNRRDVVTRCIERGINYIDACTMQEVMAYAEALRGRRDSMFLGFSWYQEELRNENFRTTDALLGTLDKGMKAAGLEYVDVWRITMHEQSGRHSEAEVDAMMAALDKARKQGKARFTGFSSHDRPHIKSMIETYPDTVQCVCTPYTAKSKVLPTDSVFEAVQKHDVGIFGIKPFSGTSLFKGTSAPDDPNRKEDDRLARMAVRYILCNAAITAPIPGLINEYQVDNMALAVKEERELSAAEAKQLEQAMDRCWANLAPEYQWLRNWEYV